MAVALPGYGEILAQVSLHPGDIAAATASVAMLWGGGQMVLRRAGTAETTAVGMGLFVFLLTVMGIGALDLRFGVAGFAVLAVVAATVRRTAGHQGRMALSLLMTLILLMPLLALLSGRAGSEWDEFSHWLRAFRYLATNHVLPGGPQVPAFDGCCGAYPYGWPMVNFAASLLSGFSEALPALINTLILGLSGLLLAETAARELNTPRLPWMAVAAGLLGATAAGPAFVPKLAFSSYADISTGFLVAVLVILGEGLATAEKGDDDEKGWRQGIGFGLCGAALMAVKPGNAGLFACALAGVFLVLLRTRGWRGWLRPDLLPAVLLPLAVAALWRWHVGQYLAGQELVVRPVELWNLREAGGIAAGMADVASQKVGHFGLGLAAVVLGLRSIRHCRDRFDRLMVQVAVLFAGYNLFLFATYVAVFGKDDALRVASFWRYNTHLGLAVMLPAALVAARLIRRAGGQPWPRMLGRAAIVLAVIGPFAALPYVRFDVDAQKQWMRKQLRDLVNRLPADEPVGLFDSLGTGLSGVIATYEWDRRLGYAGLYSGFSGQDPALWQRTVPAAWILILSGQERLLARPAPEGVLLHRVQDRWEEVARFPYPGSSFPRQYP